MRQQWANLLVTASSMAGQIFGRLSISRLQEEEKYSDTSQRRNPHETTTTNCHLPPHPSPNTRLLQKGLQENLPPRPPTRPESPPPRNRN